MLKPEDKVNISLKIKIKRLKTKIIENQIFIKE